MNGGGDTLWSLLRSGLEKEQRFALESVELSKSRTGKIHTHGIITLKKQQQDMDGFLSAWHNETCIKGQFRLIQGNTMVFLGNIFFLTAERKATL